MMMLRSNKVSNESLPKSQQDNNIAAKIYYKCEMDTVKEKKNERLHN
jgi:hypothetical protein